MMKLALKVMTSVVVAITVSGFGSSVDAQSGGTSAPPNGGKLNGCEVQLSEKTATRLSAFGTLVPAGLGLIVALSQKGEDYRVTVGMYGESEIVHRGPDRLAPISLISSGVVIGPSLGYFYAGRPGRAFAGMGIRTAIGFGSLIGAFATCGWNCGPGDGAYNTAWGIMVVGGAVALGSAIHDISKVDDAVRSENQKHRHPKLAVMPEYFPGSKAVGLRAKLVF